MEWIRQFMNAFKYLSFCYGNKEFEHFKLEEKANGSVLPLLSIEKR